MRDQSHEFPIHLLLDRLQPGQRAPLSRRREIERWAIESITGGVVKPERIQRQPGIKPRFSDPDRPDLHISHSLSHTSGLLAVAAAADRHIGIDVECVTCASLNSELLALTLDHSEQLVIATLTGSSARLLAFHRLWTRKEAVLKACGAGLSISPAHVRVGLGTNGSWDPVLLPDGTVWYVVSLPETQGAAIAMGSDRPGGPIVWRWRQQAVPEDEHEPEKSDCTSAHLGSASRHGSTAFL